MDSHSSEVVEWALGIITIVVTTVLGWSSKLLISLRRTAMTHAERIARVEAKALAEREVREIVQSEIKPIKDALHDIQEGTKANQEILTELRVSNGVMMQLMDDRKKK